MEAGGEYGELSNIRLMRNFAKHLHNGWWEGGYVEVNKVNDLISSLRCLFSVYLIMCKVESNSRSGSS